MNRERFRLVPLTVGLVNLFVKWSVGGCSRLLVLPLSFGFILFFLAVQAGTFLSGLICRSSCGSAWETPVTQHLISAGPTSSIQLAIEKLGWVPDASGWGPPCDASSRSSWSEPKQLLGRQRRFDELFCTRLFRFALPKRTRNKKNKALQRYVGTARYLIKQEQFERGMKWL